MVESKNDEMNLAELTVKVKKILVRNKIIIISLTIVGILLGLLYFSLKPDIYRSEIVVKTTVLDQSLIEILNKNLTQLINNGNRDALAFKLNISKEVAPMITKVTIERTDEKAAQKPDNIFYIITVESLSNEHWTELEKGIMYFLSNNTFVKKRIDMRAKQYKSFIDKLTEEISQIDSLKKDLYNSGNLRNDNLVMMNPGEVYTALAELFAQRQKLEEELEFNQAVEVVEDFEAQQQPVSPRPVLSIIIGGFIGFILGIFVAFGRELNRYLKQYERTHS